MSLVHVKYLCIEFAYVSVYRRRILKLLFSKTLCFSPDLTYDDFAVIYSILYDAWSCMINSLHSPKRHVSLATPIFDSISTFLFPDFCLLIFLMFQRDFFMNCWSAMFVQATFRFLCSNEQPFFSAMRIRVYFHGRNLIVSLCGIFAIIDDHPVMHFAHSSVPLSHSDHEH